jgi:hypothetical protein
MGFFLNSIPSADFLPEQEACARPYDNFMMARAAEIFGLDTPRGGPVRGQPLRCNWGLIRVSCCEICPETANICFRYENSPV